MFFEVKKRDLAGRIGKLITRHGILETPVIFPVIDPLRQIPDLSSISSVGFKGIITNAYLFYKRNKGVIKSIHSELSWNNIVMTDSGGYQILLYGNIDIDNRTIVNYEKAIGSDIATILDIPTGSTMSREEAERAVLETYKRGLESLPLIEDSEQLWVYPIQGAPFKDILLKSCELAVKLPYHIYAVGSPTIMLEKYRYAELIEIVALVRVNTSLDRPLHVFGVGHPMIIPFLVAIGADMFDSASYILYARDGRYLVEEGTKNIRELEYFPCACPICSKYTPQELLQMPPSMRERLLALHNLHVIYKEIRSVKQAIKENRLWELLEWRANAHPSLKEAFAVLLKYMKFIEKLSPLTSPSGRALLILSEFSYYNPKISLNIKRVNEILARRIKDRIIIVLPAYRKPYISQKEYVELSEKYKSNTCVKILFLHPILGVIPPEIAPTYPFYQHEYRISKYTVSLKLLKKHIKELLDKKPRRVVLVLSAWLNEELANKIVKRLETRGVEISICRLYEVFSLIPQ